MDDIRVRVRLEGLEVRSLPPPEELVFQGAGDLLGRGVAITSVLV